ncbi:MAG: NUDIX domain-containing protein [Alphaproteobacteria bacterium]|nr:NUDIX domain-containing protein [Alphaproteobacteria bacterium]
MTDETSRPPDTAAPEIDLIEAKPAYEGYGRVRRYLFRHRRFDGTWSSAVGRELFESGDAVVVLPYDPVRDEVVLVEQVRVAPLARNEPASLLECIAGRIGRGESPAAVARKEATEEAACPLGELIAMGSYFSSPGIFAELIHYFCARTSSEGLGGVHGLAEEDEDIRVHVLSTRAAFDALTEGRIRSGPAVIALQWLGLYRDAVRAAWTQSEDA